MACAEKEEFERRGAIVTLVISQAGCRLTWGKDVCTSDLNTRATGEERGDKCKWRKHREVPDAQPNTVTVRKG